MTKNYKWNLDFSTEARDIGIVKAKCAKFVKEWRDHKDYLIDPVVLRKALDDYEEWACKYGLGGDPLFRTGLEGILDQDNPEIKARYNKLYEEAVRIENELEFFMLNLGKIAKDNRQKFLEHLKLTEYNYFLERIFEHAKYDLSEPEEMILNLKSKTSHGNWVSMLEDLLSTEEREGKSFSEITGLLSDEDKATRDKAAGWFNQILRKYNKIAEYELNSVLENNQINLNLRKYETPEQPRHLSDDISEKMIQNLLDAVTKHNHISKKFYQLKAGLLGVAQLEYHERNVPYSPEKRKISIESSVETVRKTFEEMDPWAEELFVKYVEEGRIDALPKKGKSGGAACVSNLKTQPIYIFLNHTGRLRDTITLAHEMGHALHAELINEKQHALYTGSSLTTAETASTLTENLVREKLIGESEGVEKLSLMVETLNDSVSSIQRQVACYRFERDLHRKFEQSGYLAKETIGEIFQEHMLSYMGDYVDQSCGSKNWWIYWSHIRNFFYVYSYASGSLIAQTLQARIREDPSFFDQIKLVLSLGTSTSPKDAFKKIGIDISNKEFWTEGLGEQKRLLDSAWTLAEKLGKI